MFILFRFNPIKFNILFGKKNTFNSHLNKKKKSKILTIIEFTSIKVSILFRYRLVILKAAILEISNSTM